MPIPLFYYLSLALKALFFRIIRCYERVYAHTIDIFKSYHTQTNSYMSREGPQ